MVTTIPRRDFGNQTNLRCDLDAISTTDKNCELAKCALFRFGRLEKEEHPIRG